MPDIRASRLTETQTYSLGPAWAAVESELPDGWVVAGVMRRADVPFMVDADNEVYIAIAVKEGANALGPVPEVRASGGNPTSALYALRLSVREARETGSV